jgi:hypothetical protein
MIGPGGLLLVVPTYMPSLHFYWWGCQKKQTAKLRHLILLSRVTYWAPMEMLYTCNNLCDLKKNWVESYPLINQSVFFFPW